MKTESRAPTAGAMRAAEKVCDFFSLEQPDIPVMAGIIDRATGCCAMAEALKAALGDIDAANNTCALSGQSLAMMRQALKAGQL